MNYVQHFGPMTLPGKGKERIDLKPYELSLFQELLIHQAMPSKEIHNFLKQTSEKPMNSKNITDRLRRLVESKLLIRIGPLESRLLIRIDPDQRSPLYFYKLSKRGIQCLANNGVINEEEVEKFYRRIMSTNIYSLPLVPSAIANRVKIESMKSEWEQSYVQYPGIGHSLRIKMLQIKGFNVSLVPSWTFQKGNRYVFLEMETGSPSSEVIESLMKHYMLIAEDNPEDEVIVVFSFTNNMLGVKNTRSNRSKRVENIKEAITNLQNGPSNLWMYAMPTDRTPPLLLELIFGIRPINSVSSANFISHWKNSVMKNFPV